MLCTSKSPKTVIRGLSSFPGHSCHRYGAREWTEEELQIVDFVFCLSTQMLGWNTLVLYNEKITYGLLTMTLTFTAYGTWLTASCKWSTSLNKGSGMFKYSSGSKKYWHGIVAYTEIHPCCCSCTRYRLKPNT